MRKKASSILAAALGVITLASCNDAQTTTVESTVPTTTIVPTTIDNTISTTTDSEPTSIPKNAIKQFVIGTTTTIEKAVYGEYAYDMLASGVSEIPLVYQSMDGSYHDLLCTYKTEDSISWTYTVKDGMCFSDGVSVTAEDILFTLQYEDENGAANLVDQTVNDKTTAKKYESYSLSEDKKSITLKFAQANVRELSNMTSFRIVPKHILENNSNPTDADLRVTAGPYVLDSFNKSAGTLKFKKNTYYPDEVNVDSIIYQLYANDDMMYQALQNGEIDTTWVYSKGTPTTYLDTFAASDDFSISTVAQTNAPAVLAFNNAKGIFQDENLRIAVSYALDYEQFKKSFGSSYSSVSSRGFIPSSTFGYKVTEANSLNIKKAEEYLAKSGYTTKNASGFYEKDGKELSFTLTVSTKNSDHARYAELVKTNIEKLGIKVVLELLDPTAYNAKTSNKFSDNNITMEAAIFGYTSAGMGMMAGLATIYVNGNHAVQGGCQVYAEEFQKALEELSNAKTTKEYEAAAAKIQDYYANHTPLIALYNDSISYVYNAKYKNITPDLVFGLNSIPNWLSIEQA